MIRLYNFMVILLILLLSFPGCTPTENQEEQIEEQIMEQQNNNIEINTMRDKESDKANSAAILNNSKHEPEPNLEDFSEKLNTYEGKGFTIQYPANARVVEKNSDTESIAEVEIIGPNVLYRLMGGAVISGPFYSLNIKTFPNPDRLSAEKWAREYILTSWQEALTYWQEEIKRGEFSLSLPVTDDGKIEENRVKKVTIANQPAFRVDMFEPDATSIYFYFSNNEQIIVVNLYFIALPLRQVEYDICSLILNTFRITEL